MFDQIHRSKLLFWSLEILIVATLIWVCTKIDFLFSPIATFFNTIFMPILLAGVLFYLLNPVVKLIQKIKIGKYHISRTWAVALIFLIFFAVLAGGIVWLIPRLIQQVSTLVNNVPNIIKIIQNGLTDINDKLSSYKWLQNVDFSKYGAQIEKIWRVTRKSL